MHLANTYPILFGSALFDTHIFTATNFVSRPIYPLILFSNKSFTQVFGGDCTYIRVYICTPSMSQHSDPWSLPKSTDLICNMTYLHTAYGAHASLCRYNSTGLFSQVPGEKAVFSGEIYKKLASIFYGLRINASRMWQNFETEFFSTKYVETLVWSADHIWSEASTHNSK